MGTLRLWFLNPIIALLTQGITPEKIALSMTFGIVLGVFPMLGTTTILCLAASSAFRLNWPAMQLINYVVYPLQLALIVPLIRVGEFLLNAPPFPLTVPQMFSLAQHNMFQAIRTVWVAALHAAFAWALLVSLAFTFIYFILAASMRRVALLASRVQDGEITDVA